MKRNEKKKSKTGLILILVLLFAVIAAGLAAVLMSVIQYGFTVSPENIIKTIKGDYYWKIIAICGGAGVAFLGIKLIDKTGKKSKEYTEGEDARLFTKKDMKRSRQFLLTEFHRLDKAKDGVVLGAEKKRKHIDVIMSKEPQHTLVIGTTGSGKTTGYLNPTIQILASTESKPSFIISDPKGELFLTHSKLLKQRGYDVHVLDLRNPYESSKWNPFQFIIDMINKLKITQRKLESLNEEKDAEKIYELKVEVQKTEDEIYENTTDLVYAVCPVDDRNASAKDWKEGARNFILALTLAFIEDAVSGYFEAEKLTLFNIYHNISNYAQGTLETLSKYLLNRSSYSPVRSKAATVLSAVESEKTLASYLTDVAAYVSFMSDRGMQLLTSENDIDFDRFDEKPTALFIKVPDEKVTRHTLVSLLIVQCYKVLIDKARKNEETGACETARLKRRLYFLLDEFGNLPKFENIGAMISVGRSRQIFFNFILQNLEQLDQKYGAAAAKIVKDNCPVRIFLGTDSIATMEEFCKLAGKKKGEAVSVSGGEKGLSTTTSVKEVSLITVSDLKTLNNKDDFGNALVSAFGYPLFYSKYTPSWKCRSYVIGATEEHKERQVLFDADKNVFDVKDWVDVVDAERDEIEKIKADELERQRKEEELQKEDRKKTQEKRRKQKDLLTELLDEDTYTKLMGLQGEEKEEYIKELMNSTEDIAVKLALKKLLDRVRFEVMRGMRYAEN